MSDLQLRPDDLISHLVQVTMEFAPPLQFPQARARLLLCADKVAQRFLQYATSIHTRPDGVQLMMRFFPETTPFPFLTIQGGEVVFMVPVGGGDIGGVYEPTSLDYRTTVADLQQMFFSHVASKPTRVTVLRGLIFNTGQDPLVPFVTARGDFGGMMLSHAALTLKFHNQAWAHQVALKVPSEGDLHPLRMSLRQDVDHALDVLVHVANMAVRPMTDAEIGETLDRADALWPETILHYVNTNRPGIRV